MTVFFVPTTVACLWLCVLGGNAIYLEMAAAGRASTAGIAEPVRNWNLPAALFGTIDRMTDVSALQWASSRLPPSSG